MGQEAGFPSLVNMSLRHPFEDQPLYAPLVIAFVIGSVCFCCEWLTLPQQQPSVNPPQPDGTRFKDGAQLLAANAVVGWKGMRWAYLYRFLQVASICGGLMTTMYFD